MTDYKRYNYAKFTINGTDIIVESFKLGIKQETTEHNCSSSAYPYEVSMGKISLDWDLTKVAARHYKLFKSLLKKQNADPDDLAQVAIYDYNEQTGDLVEADVLYGVYVTEISPENSNDPFSVKGKAKRMKDL